MKSGMLKLSILVFLIFGLSINKAQTSKRSGAGQCRMTDKLNLTEEQKESIDNFRYEHQESVIELRSQFERNRLEMDKLMDEVDLDQSRILDLSKTGSELRGQIQESRTRMWLNIYNTLDESQKEIWKKSRMGSNKFDRKMRGIERRGHYNRKGLSRIGQNREYGPERRHQNSRRRK